MLRKVLIGLFAGITLFTMPVEAKGKKNQKQKTEQTVATENALLWKISGKGIKDAYLYGTIHMICKEDYSFSDNLAAAYKNTDVLALEVDLSDPSVQMQMAMGMMSTDGKTIESYFTADEFAQLDEIITNSMGVSLKQFNSFHPNFLLTVLATSFLPCATIESYDMNLMTMATNDKKTLKGLESIETQLDALKAMPADTTVKQLKDYLKHKNDNTVAASESAVELQKIVDAYKQQNLEQLYKLSYESKSFDEQSKKKLFDDRNTAWIPVMIEMAKDNAVLFAVGAGHLPGKKGVINLLREAGYTVEAVK